MTTENRQRGRPKTQMDDPLTSPKEKGIRLRRVRNLANLTREKLCEDCGINIHTYIGWECGRFGGLTVGGANKILKRLEKEGVFCSVDWLIYEIGAGPSVRVDYHKIHEEPILDASPIDDSSQIVQELLFFRKLHPQSVEFLVEDNGMLPHYQIGDYVAGNKRFRNNIKNVLGLDCIVQTNEGQTLLRNLRQGPRPESFNLICVNAHTNVKDAVLYDIELISAAPIIWHRRKDYS